MKVVSPKVHKQANSKKPSLNRHESGNEARSLPSIWRGVMDQYQLLDHLGEGSFGQVVKAKHNVSGKIYAIKLV